MADAPVARVPLTVREEGGATVLGTQALAVRVDRRLVAGAVDRGRRPGTHGAEVIDVGHTRPHGRPPHPPIA